MNRGEGEGLAEPTCQSGSMGGIHSHDCTWNSDEGCTTMHSDVYGLLYCRWTCLPGCVCVQFNQAPHSPNEAKAAGSILKQPNQNLRVSQR